MRESHPPMWRHVIDTLAEVSSERSASFLGLPEVFSWSRHRTWASHAILLCIASPTPSDPELLHSKPPGPPTRTEVFFIRDQRDRRFGERPDGLWPRKEIHIHLCHAPGPKFDVADALPGIRRGLFA